LTVAGERVQRHVGDHTQLGEMGLERPHRPLRQTFWIISFGGIERFRFRWRHREQGHRRHAQFRQRFGFA